LEVERHIHEDREQRPRDAHRGELDTGEAAVLEEAERKHRFGDAGLDGEKRDAEDAGAGELGDGRRGAPADLVPAQQRQNQKEHAAGAQQLADPVGTARVRVA
jgi:hypothetical protein